MMRTWAIVLTMLGLGAALAQVEVAAAAEPAAVSGVWLPDQSGHGAELVSAGQNTLLVFYRGDW